MSDEAAPRQSFTDQHRKVLLGFLAVAMFIAAWQAVFLFVPFNPLFISKPESDRRTPGRPDRQRRSLRDLAVSAVPFMYGFTAAVIVGVPLGIVMGWRVPVGYALDPLMTMFYASPLVALAPLVVVFFGVGVSGKALHHLRAVGVPVHLQRLCRRARGRPAADQRGALARRLGDGPLSQGDRAERAALHRRRRAHRGRPRRWSASWSASSSRPPRASASPSPGTATCSRSTRCSPASSS